MESINWKGVDLNLLVAFSQLYRHRSVSLAAEKNHVSQSAMSHSLSRLRALFNDPLFVRKGHVMLPTEQAATMAPLIEELLHTVQHQLLTTSQFVAHDYQGVCRIGLTDYAEFIFAPVIFDEIRRQAPQSQVSFVNVNRHNYSVLTDSENLDVVIGSFPQLAETFSGHTLYQEEHVCLCRDDLFENKDALSLEDFISIEHALVSPDGQLSTQVDALLKQEGLTRNVTVASRNFLTIRSLLSHRRLLAIVPQRMATATGFDDRLIAYPPPVPVANFTIQMAWLSHRTHQEKNVWLRTLLLNCLQ